MIPFLSDDMVNKRYVVELEIEGKVIETTKAYPADIKNVIAAYRMKGVMSRKEWSIYYRVMSVPFREESRLSFDELMSPKTKVVSL